LLVVGKLEEVVGVDLLGKRFPTETEEFLDVLEAKDQNVVIEAKHKAWTFGTVGQGLDVM
jgi:hypothetical protein